MTPGERGTGGSGPDGRTPRPAWLKVRLPGGENYVRVRRLVHEHRLNTVCQDARCPNIGECWGAGTATIMILGEVCTRACKFCAVKTGRPPEYDLEEPQRVADAVRELGIRYAVITSVDRDDLEDGGAYIFAETIRRIRAAQPETRIEVLVPDFRGNLEALRVVVEADPEVLAHNIETVPRLYATARAGSRYSRSLDLLRAAKASGFKRVTKSSLMLGLGESESEIQNCLRDLCACQVDIVTLGQYLQPTADHLPVHRYYSPHEFEALKSYALSLGFRHVMAGPLVRSSYHAEQQASTFQGTRR